MKNILPLILAGGLGTRLGSFTRNIPKPMILIKKRFFIHYVLDQLITYGFNEVFLSIGHKANYFRKNLGEKYKELKINYIEEHEPLGTGGAIKNSFRSINADKILVMNGDSYCDVNLKNFFKNFKEKYDVFLVGVNVKNANRFGNVVFDKKFRILKFEEKKNIKNSIINAGIYIFKKNFFEKSKFKDKFSLEISILSNCKDFSLYIYPKGQKFIDIGTPKSLLEAYSFF